MKIIGVVLCLVIPYFAFTQQVSILSTGDWYKIGVNESGIYKLTYENLQSFGVDVDQINPQKLALFGNPAGMLSEALEDDYLTDLQPMSIKVVGEEDGVFDPQDYVLFYGQSPGVWQYDEQSNLYHHTTNIYSQKTYYFLTLDEQNGKRISVEQSTELEPTAVPLTYDLLISHELELINPGKTGKVWLGEDFSQSDTIRFFPETENTVSSDVNYLNVNFAANCTEESHIKILINGNLYKTLSVPITLQAYLHYKTIQFDSVFSAGGGPTEIAFVYDRPNDSARAWIDHFELQMKMNKVMAGNQMPFRTSENTGVGSVTEFSLNYDSPENLSIWNITNPVDVKEIALTLSLNQVQFRLTTDTMQEFHAFDNSTYFNAEFVGQIENQNLHQLTPPDYLIITTDLFLDATQQLEAFHNNSGSLTTTTVTVDKIYNEFSSGAQDITAIRNFVRDLRLRSGSENKPAYLLLFGDASYDYLNRVENNTNFVPTYQSAESANSVSSYASDHYFGLNSMTGSGSTQLAVGRVPVSTLQEANMVVNKAVHYNSPESFGSWKNEWLFLADDGDNNLHLDVTESFVQINETNSPVVNNSKVYSDFFDLVQTNDGPRYPEVNEILTSKMNEGVFYVNYTGHGGVDYLAHEQILSQIDIDNWTNIGNLPLWVISSGEVAYYDNPEKVSIGEKVYLNAEGGAMALIASSRATYASANLIINTAIIETLANQELQPALRFGDLLMQASSNTQLYKWNLLGDPAQKILFPEFNVATTTINGIDIGEFSDTLMPGSPVVLQGQIVSRADGGLQNEFAGTVMLSVLAPSFVRSTLGNQGNSNVVDVIVQDSVLVKGVANVENGKFEMGVTLPAQPWDGYGLLKFSWYADNGETDANGYLNQCFFGGTPSSIAAMDMFLDEIKVYPTVFDDFLNIDIPPMNNQAVEVHVYNELGIKIYASNIRIHDKQERLYLPGLEPGLYILQLKTTQDSRNIKVLKQ